MRAMQLVLLLLPSVYAFRVELHVHLDGALSAEDLLEICAVRGFSDCAWVPRYVSSAQTWHRFDRVNELLAGDVGAIRLAAKAVVRRQALENVSYGEVRYDPVRLASSTLQNGSITEEQAVEAVQQGLAAASREYQVEAYQILCAMRGKSPQQCLKTADLALKLRSLDLGGVVGLDLAGDETDYPNAAYIDCMRYAKDRGLNITVHSGEFTPSQAQDVRSAVHLMGADRVGHGYAATLDQELMLELAQRRVHLEACPKSALRHGAWAYRALEQFRSLSFGLNRDDPSEYFANTSMKEVEELVRRLNFTEQDIQSAYAAAYGARFGPRDTPVYV